MIPVRVRAALRLRCGPLARPGSDRPPADDAIEHLEHVDFEEESGPDLARELGEDLVGEVLAGLDVEVSVVGRLVDEGIGRVVVETAERHDCDHVFLVGHSRSRAADALFGDAARYVVHHFDGSVTVRTE